MILVILASLLCIKITLASDWSDASSVDFISPVALKDFFPNGVLHREALFGTPNYGVEVGKLYYATPTRGSNGCTDFTESNLWNKDGENFYLLIDRGNCHFSTKVEKAQLAGASGVIIADNEQLPDEPDITCKRWSERPTYNSQTSSYSCPVSGAEYKLTVQKKSRLTKDMCQQFPGGKCLPPYLADDLATSSITIPAMIISAFDAEIVKRVINHKDWSLYDSEQAGQYPTTALDWEIPPQTDEPKWEFYTTSNDGIDANGDNGAEFKLNMASMYPLIANATVFKPRYVIYDGTGFDCACTCSTGSTDTKKDNCVGNYDCPCSQIKACVNQGKYCYFTPVSDIYRGIKLTGQNVLEENLRQICIWWSYNQTLPDQLKWWNYVNDFNEACYDDFIPQHDCTVGECGPAIRTCSEQQMVKNNIDVNTVENCVRSAANVDSSVSSTDLYTIALDDNHDNYIFADEIAQLIEYSIFRYPSVVVNGKEVHGGVTTSTVLTTLCNTFLANARPDICKYILSPLGCEVSTGDLSYAVSHTVRIKGMTDDDFSDFNEAEGRLMSSLSLRVHSCVSAVQILSNRTEQDADGTSKDLDISFRIKNLQSMEEAKYVVEHLLSLEKLGSRGFRFAFLQKTRANRQRLREYRVVAIQNLEPVVRTINDNTGNFTPSEERMLTYVAIVAVAASIMFVMGCFCYHKYYRRRMHEDVMNILAEYRVLEEDDEAERNGRSSADLAPTTVTEPSTSSVPDGVEMRDYGRSIAV